MDLSRFTIVLVVLLAFGSPLPAAAMALEAELFAGAARNLRTPLRIAQEDEERIDFAADYATRPFAPPLYYAVRVRRRRSRWTLDLLHHKLHLVNAPEEVQHFSITHGFNLLTLGRFWVLRGVRLHAGAGAVIAHPENRVRGRKLREGGGIGGLGYHFTGPVLSAGIGKRFRANGRIFLSLDTRVTLARAVVPVQGGEAELVNVAFHALAGLGLRLGD